MSKKITTKNEIMNARRKAERREKQRRDRRLAALKKAAIILGIIVAAVLAVLLVANLVIDSGILLRSYVLKSENFTFTRAMMSYCIYYQYESFLSYYGDYVQQYTGLDPTGSLKTQYKDSKEGITWFRYFADTALDSASDSMYLCEAAHSAGYDLSDSRKQSLRRLAEKADTSLYGRGVTADDIYDALYIQCLATEYDAYLYDKLGPDGDQIRDYYKKYPTACQSVDYYSYSIKYTDDTADECKKAADLIADAADPESFKCAIMEYYTDKEYTEIDEDDEVASEVLGSIEKTCVSYDDADLQSWMFTKADLYDTYVYDNTSERRYTVYMLTAEPYLDEQKTVDVRHILILSSDYDTDEACRAEAERILRLFLDGDASEEAFACLAAEYSRDPGSAFLGGLYRRVARGDMTEAFDDWCFDSARTSGETDIIKTDYGYHVMYYVGDNIENWETDYFTDVAGEAMNDLYIAYSSKYDISENSSRVYSIPERKR